MNGKDWIQEITEKRFAYGVSVTRLATTAGISREYLSRLEHGKATVTEEVKEKLLYALEKLNPDNPLDLIFDYVRIRFPTLDVEPIIRHVLGLKIEYTLCQDYGFYGYPEHYVYGDIFVLVDAGNLERGVLVELKGKGCRQLENFMLAQQRDWFDFFNAVYCFKGVIKRLDLAVNDKVGVLNLPELIQKCKNEECVSVFRTFKNYESGELVRSVHREEKLDMGNTLYIGSMKSDIYFCIYEKDYEQYVKMGILPSESDVKNRFELRLKNQRAEKALNDLILYRDVERTTFGIINRYLRFTDREDGRRREFWKQNERWKYFMGDGREKIRLTMKPEPYSWEKTKNWFRRQVASMMKVGKKIDEANGTNEIEEMIQKANISQKHYRILEQQITPVEEVIEQ